MKSMGQMQEEMLSQARFDGGYPRAVLLSFGIVALARNEAEYLTLRRHQAIGMWVYLGGVIATVAFLGLLFSGQLDGLFGY